MGSRGQFTKADKPEWHHLPRLSSDHYRSFAVVLWTITLQGRTRGWLDKNFHLYFRELLLHAAARESVFCPAYVLMPDHLHLVWMGMSANTDQRNAMRFLRRHLQLELSARSNAESAFALQKQSHDHVLREQDRERDAFQHVCFYVLDNPRRAGFVTTASDWEFLGAVIPGYPVLDPLGPDYWECYWKLYWQLRNP
jgi:putative transposase